MIGQADIVAPGVVRRHPLHVARHSAANSARVSSRRSIRIGSANQHRLLTGMFTADTTFLDWRSRGVAFGQALFTPENFPRNVAVADQLKDVAARLDTTLPKLAIAWVLSNSAVSVAVSGTRTSAEIEHNVVRWT
jgi:aryl-alcohol dehydrogenase-like predicted oxidoreductase